MSVSNTCNLDILRGLHGDYQFGECIGRGGNGAVYTARIINADEALPNTSEYVIKLLTLDRIADKKERNKRRERFWREIENVSQIQGRVEGIVPIIDHALNQSEEDSENWYLMPRAKKLRYGQRTFIEKTLEIAINIGNIVQEIHQLGIAHRDIKPSNIVFYNNRPALTDFGLVWSERDETITETGEHIGPVLIRPPELEYYQRQGITNFYPSDIYLFAKTVWIMLTGINTGFWGEYSRNNSRVYLKENLPDFNMCLEPLNQLFEKATYNDPKNRCTLEECLHLLTEELGIVRAQILPQMLQQYKYNESITESMLQTDPDELIYKDSDNIIRIVTKLQDIAEAKIIEYEEEFGIGRIRSIEYKGDNSYLLKIRQCSGFRLNGETLSLLVCVDFLSISKDKRCEIKIKQPLKIQDGIPATSNIKEIISMAYPIVQVAGSFTITLN